MRARPRGARVAAAIVGALLATLALASCSSSPGDQGGPDPQLRGQWLLVDATDDSGAINLLSQDITLTVDRDSNTGGRSSCSDYTADIFGNASELWVRATIPQPIECVTTLQQTLEFRYLGDLNRVRGATVGTDDLTLTAPKLALHFQRVPTAPLKSIENRTWDTEAVTPLSLDPKAIPITILERGASIRLGPKGALTVVSGCGSLAGHYVVDAGVVVSDHVHIASKTSCGDYTEAFNDYLAKLVYSGFTFTTGPGQLTLTSTRALVRIGFSLR